MKYFTKEEKEKFLLSDYLKMSDDMFKKEIFKELIINYLLKQIKEEK